MKRSTSRRDAAYPVLILVFLFCGGIATLAAQTPHPQPELLLAFGDDTGELNEAESQARRLLYAAVEARFIAQRRYRVSRSVTDLSPEQYVAQAEDEAEDGGAAGRVVLFLRLTPRLDGSMRVDADVYKNDEFQISREDDLPVGDQRFPEVDRIANELTDAVGALFPGFGRIRFTNSGYPANFVVRIDGRTLGSNIDEIELPVGSYEIEIRRRDEGFSHPIGRRTLRLDDDDFVEIVFSLDRDAPAVPGFMRLTDPTERWRVIFSLRGSLLLPLEGFNDLTPTEGWSTTATVLFADIPFRSAVVGMETGHLRFNGTIDEDPSDIEIAVEMTPILGSVGLTVGPVSGVDFVARVGGGAVLYRVNEEVRSDGSTVFSYYENRRDPAFSGTAEFGLPFGERTRLSLQTALLGFFSEGHMYSWLQLGIGVGGRF